jgi:Flp pilus assembly protein TadD
VVTTDTHGASVAPYDKEEIMLRITRDASPARHIAAAGLVVLAVFAACSTREEPDGGRPVETTPPTSEPVTSGGDIAKATPVIPVSYDEGESAFREKRFGDAVEKFSAYTDQHPENPWGHFMLGLSAWKAGDRVTAEGAFVTALERDPTHVKSLVNLGRVLLEDGRPREAREKITAALAVDSTSGEVHRLMGRVQGELKQHEEAVVSYRRALSLDPTDSWSMNNMALIFILQDRYEEALPALARATRLEPTVAVFQNNLGIALERTGRYALAAEAYGAAVAADSSYDKAVMSLARVQSLKDDPALVPIDLSLLAESFDKEVRTLAVKP